MKKYILLLFICLPIFSAIAQEPEESTDEQLAAQYMQSRDFEKAAYYYEKLFAKKPIDYYYNNLLTALLEIEDFKEAEKLVKRQSKRNSQAFTYQVDLGYVYNRQGDRSRAEKTWESSLDALPPVAAKINELASAFANRKELDYSLNTYLKGRKLLKGEYPFSFEIADIRGQQGDMPGMINEYLDVLLISESYIQQVQNHLARQLNRSDQDLFAESLRTELLRRTQRQPDKTIFAELLIWYYMQDKNFAAALVQAKALDKRQREDGSRVYSLSRMALEVKDYDAAIKGYAYLLEKGDNTYYYIHARIEMLQALTKKVTEQGQYSDDDIIELEAQYLQTLKELGRKASTAPLLKNLAHLYAFYMNRSDDAIELLDQVIVLPGIQETLVAEAKMELADILLITGDIWEASLLYSQVDKAFKHDPVGDLAKFKNAKLSYYTGDFKWAQAQLDILKGSTSKLIANDAMQLALLISDNSTVDTNTVPLLMYARAELLSYRNMEEDAMATLDSINHYFPGHDLADEILFRKAKIHEKKRKFEAAANMYEQLLNAYGYDILGDDALFRLAELNHFFFRNEEEAKKLYQRLLTDYPGSLFVVEARKRFRELRGDVIN